MCPICGQSEFKLVGKPRVSAKAEKVVRKQYSIVRCTACGFYYLKPKLELSKDEWQVLYDLEYFLPMNKWLERRRKRDIVKRLNKLQEYSKSGMRRYLDVGAGEGYALIEASRRGWEVHGVDITDHRIQEAKSDKFKFYHSDLLSARLPDNYFDFIYVDSVLEHVPNPMEVLRELKRILADGGVIYIGVPNENSLFTIAQQIAFNLTGRSGESSRLKPFASPFHIGGFTRNSLRLAIDKSGLSIIKFRNFASKSDILNARFLSRDFFIAAFYLPISLIAFPLRMEIYFEAYITK